MKSKSFDGMVCSIARALETIGDRWAILILRDLSLGLSRYEDLRQSSGITNATLSDRLKHLEGNDLIERRQEPFDRTFLGYRPGVGDEGALGSDGFHCLPLG